MKPKIAIMLALKKWLPFSRKYNDNNAKQTIKISTWPLEIIAKRGKLIFTINKENGLIQKILFFKINIVVKERLRREIKLKKFFDNSYGKYAKGAKM